MFLVAIVILTSQTPPVVKQEVILRHRRPSQLLEEFKEIDNPRPQAQFLTGLQGGAGWKVIAEDIKLTVDDSKGRFVIEGPDKDNVREMAKMVEVFDVEPKRLKVSVSLDSPWDHLHLASALTTVNYDEWTASSSIMDTYVTGKCVAFDDGYATLFLNVRCSTGTVRCTRKVKLDRAASLGIHNSAAVSEPTDLPKPDPKWQIFGNPPAVDIKGNFPIPISVEVRIQRADQIMPSSGQIAESSQP